MLFYQELSIYSFTTSYHPMSFFHPSLWNLVNSCCYYDKNTRNSSEKEYRWVYSAYFTRCSILLLYIMLIFHIELI